MCVSVCVRERACVGFPCRSAERLAWRSEEGKTQTVANCVVAESVASAGVCECLCV